MSGVGKATAQPISSLASIKQSTEEQITSVPKEIQANAQPKKTANFGERNKTNAQGNKTIENDA